MTMNSIQLSIHSMTGFLQLHDSNLNLCGCFKGNSTVQLPSSSTICLPFLCPQPSTFSYTSWHSIHDIASYFKKKIQTVKREKPHTPTIMSIYLTAFGLYILDEFLCSHLRPPELIFFTHTNVSSLHIHNPNNLPPLSLHLQIFPC